MYGSKLSVCDEDGTGNVFDSFEIEFETQLITVQDIITERVFQELNSRVEETRKYPLVQNRKFPFDHDEEVTRALQAFEQNHFFVLVNNRQVVDLEETVSLDEATSVSFIRLMPIQGG